MNPVRVQLHIEQLVLRGFRGVDRREFDASVRQELTELFSQHGIPSHLRGDRTAIQFHAGDLGIAPGDGSEATGKLVARAIFRGEER